MASAHDLLLATYDTGLSHSGPGIMLQHLTRRDDDHVESAIEVMARLDADVLLVTDFDYDSEGEALAALRDRLHGLGVDYADALALRPNTGIPSWLDLNHDGELSGPRDAQAYGRFAGQAGMAILSRYPIDRDKIVNLTNFLWKDLPGANLPPDMTPPEKAMQRLSTAGHYVVPIAYAPGKELNLLVWSATPPMFDGPEDRNGRRNADEAALWLHLLAGDLPDGKGGSLPAPQPPLVVMGEPNVDPLKGDGRKEALQALLADPLLQDPVPKGHSGRTDRNLPEMSDRDTAIVGKEGQGLRLEVILPSKDIKVTDAGVMWPAPGDPMASTLADASHHRPVWVRISLP